jgi:hypothetical protein
MTDPIVPETPHDEGGKTRPDLSDLLEYAALELEWHNAEPKHLSPRELITASAAP